MALKVIGGTEVVALIALFLTFAFIWQQAPGVWNPMLGLLLLDILSFVFCVFLIIHYGAEANWYCCATVSVLLLSVYYCW